jgi:HSP20 family protein
MNRLFEESLSRPEDEEAAFAAGAWSPTADLLELSDRFVLQVDLPGLGRDDFQLEVDGTHVRLKGTRRMERHPTPAHFDRVERSYGFFARTFQLTCPIDETGVTTELVDGLLQVELPKRAGGAAPSRSRRRRV